MNVKTFRFLLMPISVVFFSIYSFAQNHNQVDLLTRGAIEQQFHNITKATLSNGMTVLVYKNTKTPKVRVQIAYNIGSAVEQEGERGLAHLIEHMIFKGTKKLAEGDIEAIARKYGAACNAFTYYDWTSYYFEVDKDNWQPFLPIMADCMEHAGFEQQHLDSELKTVMQELKMREDNFTLKMIERAFVLTHPANHPYHHTVIGYREDLASLSAANLRRFYKKYYQPHRATLFIVGAVDPKNAIKLAQKAFGSIKKTSDSVNDQDLKSFPSLRQEIVTQNSCFYEDVKREEHIFYWRVPGIKSLSSVVAQVICSVLNQKSGRLYHRLVDQEKLAFNVEIGVDLLMESGIFYILVTPAPDRANQCKQIIQEEITDLMKHGVHAKELQKIVKRQKLDFFQSLTAPGSFTMQWMDSYLATGDEFDILKKSERVAAVTSDDIVAYATTYLDPFIMSHSAVYPLPENQKKRWDEEQAKIDRYTKQILSNHIRTASLGQPKFVKNMPAPKPITLNFPKPDRCITLDNGLLVQLHQNKQWPLISVFLGLKDRDVLGSTCDGIVINMMMDMLCEGSSQYSKQEIIDFFECYGAACFYSSGGAGLSCLSEDIQILLPRFFHVLTQPGFHQEAFDKVKDIVVDSYERMKDDSFSMGAIFAKKLLYENHPYGWDIDDALSVVRKTLVGDLVENHKRYVNPANMILTIVGDFELDTMEREVHEVFDSWQGAAYVAHDYPHDISQYTAKRHNIPMLRDQAVLILTRPNPVTRLHEDSLSLQVLSNIYFRGLGSRIYALREQYGLFYGAGGSWGRVTTSIKDHGVDSVIALVDPAKLDEVEKLFCDKIGEQVAGGVTQDELDATKQTLTNNFVDRTTSNGAVCNLLNDLASSGLPYDYYDKRLARLQTFSREEISAICSKYCTADNMSVIRVGRVDCKAT